MGRACSRKPARRPAGSEAERPVPQSRALSRRLRTPVKERLIEIGVHPGRAPDHATADRSTGGWHDPLAAHRPAERKLLCSDALINLLADRNLRLGRLSSLAILNG
jgi:hypothetical protein